MESQPLLSLEDDLKDLPQVVREIVPLEDDPSIPTITFRYIMLSLIFIIPGAFIDTMNSFRTTSAAYSIFFVQIAGHWCGKWLSRVLPVREVNLKLIKFNLNPGPWSIKETALLTITANSGATGNLATNGISLAQLHFNETVHPLTAMAFMLAIVLVGYAYAAIAKNVLIYDPQFTWPQALMQTTLLKSQNNAKGEDHGLAKRQMNIFFMVLIGITLWQFLPEFVFPMVSSLAILCWIAPYNSTLNFIGSGMGGMGFLNFSLDWANITSNIMLFPYWIQVIQFVAFVFSAWVLIPIVKFTDLVEFKSGLMSNSIFMSNGEKYPTNELLTSDLKFNQTAYETYGQAYLGAQRVWNVFFDYAAYISGIVWVSVFGYDQLRNSWNKFSNAKPVNHQYTDRLNKLSRAYEPIPQRWYLILFAISFATLSVILLSGQMFMPWHCCVIALVLGSIIVTPLGWLYALSGFQLPVGTFNELFYGYMVENTEVHPASGAIFGCIAGDAWYRAQYHLQSLKIGFYIHLPPKQIFWAQIYGELIGIPINYLALHWVLSTKAEYLKGNLRDPLNQWTGQQIESVHTNAIQYVVLGPSKLFHNYPLLPFGFLLGLIAPLLLFYLHGKVPRLGFNYWNTTVFFSSMSQFYGNLSTGGLSKFIGGTATMYYVFSYHHKLWKNYNYILAAAFDTGYNLSILLIFIFFSLWFKVEMPHWWGNDETSVEKCYAL